ncbi:hypothetical protein [Pseudoduganella aquatica]|uniref:Uncharacterized protein n=1 Tax=Pseudoduganella aquatica TaxID=2660641 RepID=A0A7X4KPC5_9BURK|nr:hypothetical protein [Pseudoduganella aquatica]MYN11244.1 hypothetical protein [Pseudoduganella aquatica]
MTMWKIAKKTLAILGCAEIESLPEPEQALIAECCYHRVPADAIAEMIRALRRERGGLVAQPAPNTEAIAIPLTIGTAEAAPKAGLGGIGARLAARRQALDEDERGSDGRGIAPPHKPLSHSPALR